MESCRGGGRTSWMCGGGQGVGGGLWIGGGGRGLQSVDIMRQRGEGRMWHFDFTDMLNGIRPHHVRVFV